MNDYAKASVKAEAFAQLQEVNYEEHRKHYQGLC